MQFMTFNLLFILHLLFTFSFAEVKIPKAIKYNGVSLGSKKANFHLEAFFDLLCPDSKSSYKSLIESFKDSGLLSGEKLKFTVHFVSFPVHRESFILSRAAHYIQTTYGDDRAFKFLSLLFSHQKDFEDLATVKKTRENIEEELGNLVTENIDVEQKSFLLGIQSAESKYQAISANNYAISKGISRSPMFLGNGINIDGAESFTTADWITLLKSFTE